MQRISLGLAGALLAASLAYAQTPSPGGTSTDGTSTGAPATPNPAGQKYDTGKGSASGNDNQAVVTTGTNADQPAKGKPEPQGVRPMAFVSQVRRARSWSLSLARFFVPPR